MQELEPKRGVQDSNQGFRARFGTVLLRQEALAVINTGGGRSLSPDLGSGISPIQDLTVIPRLANPASPDIVTNSE